MIKCSKCKYLHKIKLIGCEWIGTCRLPHWISEKYDIEKTSYNLVTAKDGCIAGKKNTQ